MVRWIAVFCVAMATMPAPAAGQAPKKPWLTPLDPNVKKLPLEFPAYPAAESAKMIQVPEGFEVELLASEPLVIDPVAVSWGPDGKCWVVEFADYPLGMDDHGAPGSRVRMLQDTDGDGKLDKATLFADKLNFANSCLPWREGLLVTCAPEILYLQDTDGDGKADLRQVLYAGFEEGNPQLRINGLRYGLDNWIYCANGLQTKSSVASAKSDDKIPSLSGLDFRIRPDTGRLQAVTGVTEFGRVNSSDGDWFGNDNSNPLWHVVLEDPYVKRNKNVAAPDPKVQLVTPRNALIYPLSKLQQRFNVDYMANRITSACGPEIYRDTLLFGQGPNLMGFTCEPVHNMVLRTLIEPNGATFTGRRAPGEERREFIASTDNWFRPVMLRTGPDGALWLCDYYRYTVEHPAYMTEEWRSKLPLRAGDDRGRLYRIYPKAKRPGALPRLDKLDAAGLVAALDSTNGWQRDMAQMMLIWKDDPSAAPLLEKVISGSANPYARLHALCTLDGMNALTDAALLGAMADAFPAVRRHAIRIAESRGDPSPSLIAAAAKLASDPDAKVRMQLALTLGEWESPQAGAALGKLAVQDAADPYIVAGVMSSATRHHGSIVKTVLAAGDPSGDMVKSLLEMSASLNDRAAAAQLLDRVLSPSGGVFAGWQLQAFAGWLDALPRQKMTLQKLASAQKDDLSAQLRRVPRLYAAARAVAADSARPAPDRIAAVRLLGREAGNEAEDAALAVSLLNPKSPAAVQTAAVAAVGRIPKADPVDALTPGWDGYGVEVRIAVTELLLRGQHTQRTLQLAADGKLPGFDVEYTHRQKLLKSKDKVIAELAKKALSKSSSESRAKVVADYMASARMPGDFNRGQAVFTRACFTCHRIGDVGRDVGPDLRSVTDRSPGGLITAILDPNHDIDPKYYAYLATLGSGEVLMGVLTSETGNSITILGLDGNPRTLLRQDLQSLRNTGRSLMTDGLEAALSMQDMADLIRYLGYPGQ